MNKSNEYLIVAYLKGRRVYHFKDEQKFIDAKMYLRRKKIGYESFIDVILDEYSESSIDELKGEKIE